jgi:tRNA-specific 2-thiouridylase
MPKRVLVAMSGGVDSSVAAYLLQKEGYDVVGATIKTWSSDECKDERAKGCCSIRDITDARAVAGKLGIPYYVLDLSSDFKDKVIDYFVKTYVEGRTPNPCIQCNTHIKFGIFRQKAEEIGAEWMATGHYARRGQDPATGRYFIREGLDLSKDQSYVLFGLSQEQLAKTLLPVGEHKKSDIRAMAQELGLRVFDKPDSQEICFVSGHYADFLKSAGADLPGQGDVVDRSGRVLAKHEGHHLYTIGQRKRLGVTDPDPLFVTDIDAAANRIVIGKREELDRLRMRITDINWMQAPAVKDYTVKIRSRHTKVGMHILEFQNNEAVVEFCSSQSAVTPGQAAVIYDGDSVVGGGWIQSAS